jgi:hypothetical protein
MSRELRMDYAQSGLTIQHAMLDHWKRFPNKDERPEYILWAGLRVKTGDAFPVPKDGIVRGEFLSWKGGVEQGFDIKVDGWLELEKGEKVQLLRTWNDPRYEAAVEYPFHTEDGVLWIWNVYKVRYPDDRVVEERWTGNAGFWVEVISETERVYHCSHGIAKPPDFESLVFKITVLSS